MDNDFLVKIMAMLETKGIKDDYEKIKQMFLKDPTKINTVMDMSATKTEINKFIKEYAPKLQEMFSNLGVKGINVKDIESSLKTIFSSYQKELKNMPKIIDRAYGSNNKLNDSMEITKNRAKGASQSFQSYIKSLKPIALKQYSNEINQISDSFSKASESGKSIDLSKANSHLSKFKSEMKNAGMETATLTQKLKENIGAFSQWYFIGNAIGSLVRNFKASINTIKEVDTYLTEISKTSEISAENLKKLGIDAFDYASKYGSTVGAYLSGVQEMSRAGYDESIAKGLAELSILAQSAGDMTDELANEYLIATNAAYKYEGNIQKLNDVLDSQNQVTNRNSITMSKLAEATKIAGSQAASSGVEVDELTAAITTMGVVTQAEGGVLGRAFRTILMNLRQVKGEVDGEIINEESFTKVEKAADSLGVKLKETRGGILSLRDPMQILKELAEEYSKLAEGDVRGADLISSLGGKRQGNQLIALLENFDMYEKVLNDYKNASGSAADEAQKTADSIEGRLNQLSNTWNRTVANVVDSDLIKGLTSTSTNVIDLVDKLNLLQTALIGLGGVGTYKLLTSFIPMIKNAITSTITFGNALNSIKANDFATSSVNISQALKGLTQQQMLTVLSTKQMSTQLSLMSEAQIVTGLTTAGLSVEEAKATVSTLTMASAQGVATTSTIGLGASIKALGAAMMANPIGLIITGITVAISALSFGMRKYKQAQEEAIATSKQITDEYRQENQAIDEQINKYKELQKQLNDSNTSTSEAKNIKDQLYTIQTNLIDSYGLEAEGLDLVNGKYKEQIGLLDELSKDKAQEYLAENRKAFQIADSELNKTRYYDLGNLKYGDNLIEYLKDYQENEPSLDVLNDTYAYRTGQQIIRVSANVEEADKVLHQLYNDIESYGKSTGEDVSGILDNISVQLNKTWTDELKTHKDNYDAYVDAQVIANDTLRPLYKESIDAVEAYNQAWVSGEGIDEAKSNLDDIKEKIAQNTTEVEGSQNVFDDIFSKIITGVQDVNSEIESDSGIKSLFTEAQNKAIDEYQKSISSIGKALSDLDKLSPTDIIDLMQQFPELAKYGFTGSEGIDALKLALEKVGTQLYNNLDPSIENVELFKQMYKEAMTASDSISAFSFSISVLNTLNKSLDELDKKSKDTVSSVKELNQVLYDQSQGTKLTSEQAYKLITQYPQLASALEKTTDGYTINEEAIENVRLALINQEEANANAQLNMTKDTLNAVSDRVEAYGIELESITTLQSALNEQSKLPFEKIYGSMEGFSFDDATKRITTPTGSFIADSTSTVYDSIKGAYQEQKLIHDTIGKMGNLQERINGLQNDLLSDKGFGVNEGKGGSSSGSGKDPIKEAFDLGTKDKKGKWIKGKNDLDHDLAMEEITQKQYLKGLEKINEATFGQAQDTHLEQYRQYLEEVFKGRKKIDEDNIKSKFDDLSHSFAMGDIKSEDKYQKQRWNLAKKYYKNNEGYLNEWKKAQEEWYKWNLDKAEESAKKQEKIAENLKDKYTDLIGDIADEIKKEKDDVLDSLEESHKSTIKNLEEQKDSYKEIVKTQLDLLDAKKKQNDYEKSISKQSKEISKIESRKAELEKAAKSGDRQAIAELSKLDEELAKKKEDLLDEQSDHELDLQKESLNNALDLNDKLMDAKIDAEKLRFETQKSNIEKLYDKEIELINKAAQYTKEEFSKALDEIATQLASNGITQSPSYLGSIKNSQSFIADSQINASTSNRSAILSILRNGQGKDYEDKASALAAYTRDNYGAPISKKQAVEVAKLLGVEGINSVSDLTGNDENKEKIRRALIKAKFHEGGYVDANILNNKEGYALVKHGEPILTAEQGKLFKELVNNIKPLNNLVKLSTPNISNITNKTNSPNINIPITIQGNATPSTVSALNNAGNNIVKQIMDEVRKM